MRLLNLPTLAELDAERRGKPLTKPSALAVKVRKHERKTSRKRAKDDDDRAHASVMAELRRLAFMRDRGRCRVFGTPLVLVTDNPSKLSHAHHVVFRSLGGRDELSNLATISPAAHDLIHHSSSKRLIVVGDADETLTCQLVEPETGKLLHEWFSVAGERVIGAPKVQP